MSSLLQDKRIRLVFTIAVLEWLVVGGLVLLAEQRPAFMWLVLGVASAFQMGILFWRPAPQGLFAEAQAAFMAGDYQDARQKLESLLDEDFAHLQAQTLLGNTLRQLGELAASESILQKALGQSPDDHFPLYGLARTRLAQGDFAQAAALMEKALEKGGRKAIQADLALSYYLNGEGEKALPLAQKAARLLQLESYRALMVNYLLYRLQQDPLALAQIERHQKAFPYWEGEAQRFAQTAYGQVLASELSLVRSLLEKGDLS